MKYFAKHGDSPASIARATGVSVGALFNANRHKPTTVVAGRQTWRSLGVGEPIYTGLGDAASDAVAALISAGGPCKQANVGIVCAIQTALGLKVDGKYGNDTATAARRLVPSAPPGCSPAPLWWGKKGESKCVGVPLPPISALPSLPSLPGIPAPMPMPIPVTTAPLPVAAASALLAIDPCLSVNAGMVCAAQLALGLTADGKYGPATAEAVRRAAGSAPPPCSPSPIWWGKKGESKCGGEIISFPSPSLPTPAPIPMPVIPPPISLPEPSPFIPPPVSIPTPIAPVPAAPAPVAPAPSPGAVVVTAPQEKKGLSTGAMVAAGIGAVALVGLVAVAASGKKSTSVTRVISRRSSPKRKKNARKRK